MSIWKLFGMEKEPTAPAGSSAADTETVRRIVARLDAMEADRARFLAAFAYILGRVAHADLDISNDETRSMEEIVVKLGEIPEDQAVLVVQMAKTQNLLFGGTENFLVTREFAKIASREERMHLLECLFAVASADESISNVEDHEIKRIAEEIKVERHDYIQARLAYKEHIAVLRKPGGGS